MVKRALLFLLLFSSLLIAKAVFAQVPAIAPEHVTVAIAARRNEAQELISIIRDVTEPLPARFEFRVLQSVQLRAIFTPKQPGQGTAPPLARVWIDLTSQNAQIYLVDRPWERVLVRFVPRQPGKKQLTFEQLAQILLAATEGLLAGGRIGITREAAERQLLGVTDASEEAAGGDEKVDPARPPLQRRAAVAVPPGAARDAGASMVGIDPARPHFMYGILYEAQAYSSALGAVHGPGAVVTFDAELSSLPGTAIATLQYRPTLMSSDPIGARFDVLALRLGAGVRALRTSRVELAGALGIGADLTHIDPTAGPGASAGPPRWRSYAVARLMAYGHFRLDRGAALFGSVSLDVDLGNPRFVYRVAGELRPLLEPWPVRPALALGFIF